MSNSVTFLFRLQLVLAKRLGPDYTPRPDMGFIRKGEVGGWKNYMTDELVAKFDDWTNANLAGTGLSFE